MMFLPPGASPIKSKEAAIDYLERPERDGEVHIDQHPEHMFIGEDLAVVHIVVEGTVVPEDEDDPEEVSHKGLDVYRRDEDGGWEQIISIWNDQA